MITQTTISLRVAPIAYPSRIEERRDAASIIRLPSPAPKSPAIEKPTKTGQGRSLDQDEAEPEGGEAVIVEFRRVADRGESARKGCQGRTAGRSARARNTAGLV